MTNTENPTEPKEQKPKKSSKRDFYVKIFIEILSVVFAVLLALGVDEWRDNRKNESRALKAEYNIKDEIELNIERLNNVIVENKSRIVQIDSLIKVYQDQPKLKDIDLPNMIFSLISTAAWQSVKTTETINHIKFDKVLFYSTFYDLFDIYKKKLDGFLYQNDFKLDNWNSEQAISELKRMKMIYEEVSSTAEQIDTFYKENSENLKMNE